MKPTPWFWATYRSTKPLPTWPLIAFLAALTGSTILGILLAFMILSWVHAQGTQSQEPAIEGICSYATGGNNPSGYVWTPDSEQACHDLGGTWSHETFTFLQPKPEDIALTIMPASPDGTGEPLVTLRFDGRIEYGKNYSPDAAAKIFWESMGRNIPRDCK